MIRVEPAAVLARAAAFELENDACWQAPQPLRVFLNGEARGTCGRNVFTLSGLAPGTQYELRVLAADGGEGRCTFATPRETSLVDVTAFGARGDGVFECTGAIQAALCACPPGGTVRVPEGVYLTYPLFLRSDVLLYLERGAVLLGGTDRTRYPVLPGSAGIGTWEGEAADCYASLLTAVGQSGVAVAGEGAVDGNAAASDWWIDPKRRRGAWRPRTVFFHACRGVTLLGVTVRNSPSWTIHPHCCADVDIVGVTVENPPDSPNTDGCDPESCTGVRILGTRISVGDDCIAVKSGKYRTNVAHPAPCRDLLVRNCLLERGHGGVVVGSEASSGVSGLRIERCIMRGTDRGLRVKTRRGRGRTSVLTDIVCAGVRMENVVTPFVVNMFYNCDADGHSDHVQCKSALPADGLTPSVGSLELRDVVCEGCGFAGAFLYGLPERPVESVTLENVRFSFRPDARAGLPAMMDGIPPMARRGLFARNVRRLVMRGVRFENCAGAPVDAAGAEVSGWRENDAEIVVAPDGTGDFATISEAVAAAAGRPGARIFVRNGVYREKLYCEAADLILRGESREGVRLVWADGAAHLNADGRPNGTFRSYTAYFTGGHIRVEDMTIENAAGDGREHGQSIAAAVDAARAEFFRVTLLSCQDTLFTGPLPERERIPDGFLGPRQFAPRTPSAQYYEDCLIRGDIDFIFGGADALFERCTLVCRGRGEPVNGFIAAPSTAPGNPGYVFHRCAVRGENAAPGTFFLARPWRAHGRAAFLACDLDGVIAPAGFDDWDDASNRATSGFSEFASTGEGAHAPRAFGAALTQAEADALLERARARCCSAEAGELGKEQPT